MVSKEGVPPPPPAPPADESPALHGLSTTVADERLVEEVEVVVSKFLKHVKEVTWKSCLSFLQTQEGSVTLLCSAVILCVAAYTLDYKVFGEVILVLPFHFLAWYISFRLPRAEQLRAVAKVRECLERFNSSGASDVQCTKISGGVDASGDADKGDGLTNHEAVPPSSFCVSVLRDRAWRQIPYNMIVQGDVFKLRDGEVFPCRAERLAVRPPYGAVPTGESHEAGSVFLALGVNGGRDIRSTPTICSFLALSTACIPMVTKFLQTAQKASEGRMDTVFFELAALARGRLRNLSLGAFLATALAFGLWLLRPAVLQQPIGWQLQRGLLPFRLTMCLLPLMPVILLQITDVWGNARIQALFEWHAGLAEDERLKGSSEEEASPGSGEIDASSVPLQWQLRQLLDILRQGLDGPTNLMHTLNSTTVVCFCDKEGLLTDTCTTVDEVCVCSVAEGASAAPSPVQEEEPAPDRARPITSKFRTIVLDVQSDKDAASGLRFEHPEWRNCLPLLKPLGLGMAVSRQPRELMRPSEGAALHDLSVSDLLQAMHHGYSAAMHDCLCNVSQLIGFKDQVVAGFPDVKFCMEIYRPVKCDPPLRASTNELPTAPGGSSHFPGFSSEHGRPHVAVQRVTTPSAGSENSTVQALGSSRQDLQEMESSPMRHVEYDPHGFKQGVTNFSRTLLTWFVQDTRDGSYQMFCKAKPKRLLPKCTYYFNGSKLMPLKEEDKQELMRIVLQWKASGLSAVAFAYRPLTTQPELEVCGRLGRHSFFCSTEGPDGTHEVMELRPGSCSEVPSELASAVDSLHSDQVLLGMAGVKLCASVQMASYAEALQGAGIRFQVYSTEGEKRTRTLGAQLGLDTGWNCLISLEPSRCEFKNMMGQVVLPSGIPNIRRHTKEVDNVPLLVSLYSKASPWRAQQMISILQENSECVTCVGSALQPNFETFRQANISVSVLVGNVPQCRRCLGRREPREHRPGQTDNAKDYKDLFIFSTTTMRAEYQLAADLTSLPCALQARHSYTNGEQRTLGVLFNAIKESRRCVDCILMVIIHYLCGAVQLAVIVALQSILCLPPPLEGLHVFAMLFVLLPTVSFALLFNAPSPQLMKELPLKKQDEKTLAQPGRLMLFYTIRSVPNALVVIAAFMYDLHRVFEWQLEEARKGPNWNGALAAACDSFDWIWWFSGDWPSCAAAMSVAPHRESAGRIFLGQRADIHEASCALVHAQQWGALLFVIYEVGLAFTFLDRYESLLKRGPLSNKVLCAVAIMILLVHMAVGSVMITISCGSDWHSIHLPRWESWVACIGIWPLFAIFVSECTKRRDRRYHVQMQKTLRVLFNTRLGMWSPR
uniref:Cation-transporting P-type ATPase C-terminal domain-containing protein n=1 Tax=Alexandrium monilatum TaxID=311494 RepID=A0A7S4WHY4_9DINO